ncbi:MAG: glycosyltransferase [Anaerolineales bacterium]|nr:glycosyltransferase [Anaerolineales bacterium]
MKIGLVTACYKPVVNGVTQMVALYQKYLTDLGLDVTIFTLGEPGPEGDEPSVVRSPAIPLADTGYYFGFRYSRHAQQLLREMDILHCHHLVMSMELASRYSNAPIVYTNHTRYDLYASSVFSLAQTTSDAMMRQFWPQFTDYCDTVIAPSNGLRHIMQEFGVRRPIAVIPNGIELDNYWSPPAPFSKRHFGFDETDVLGVYVGRLSAEKRLPQLLQQFALALDVRPELRLLIVGDGPERTALEQYVWSHGLSDSVRFAGSVPSQDVPNFLAPADFFVTASVSEVHPLTVIEAMAVGLPIAAVFSPGIADTVVNQQTGYLVHSGSGLAGALVGLASSAAVRDQMGAAAKTASRHFDIRQTVAFTVALYEKLLVQTSERRYRPLANWQESLAEGLRPVTEPFSRFWRDQYLNLIQPPGDARQHKEREQGG